MKRFLSILLAMMIVLSCGVLLSACSEESASNDNTGGSAAGNNNNIIGTCWHFYFGQTNGGHYIAKFMDDGSILGFAATNGSAEKGVYEYNDGKLHLSFCESESALAGAEPYRYCDIDFVEYEDGYRSTEKLEMMSGEDYLLIMPADESEFDEYYAHYEPENENSSNIDPFTELLMTGCWYMYSPQSADCEEYVFQNNGKVWIKYRDFMTGNGAYDTGLDRVKDFTVDEGSKCVTIGESSEAATWHYDREKDVLQSEIYDGPADMYIEVYLVHYNDVPTNEMINSDRARYA